MTISTICRFVHEMCFKNEEQGTQDCDCKCHDEKA